MAETNKMSVTIHGRKYVITAPESKDYIAGIAEYVDSRINSVLENNPNLTVDKACVLTALNIADDYFKALEKTEAVADNTGNTADAHEQIVEKENIDDYKAEILSLKERLKQKQDEINELLELI